MCVPWTVTNLSWWFSHVLVELFLHQFCDAHICPAKIKPFPKGGKVRFQNLLSTVELWFPVRINTGFDTVNIF